MKNIVGQDKLVKNVSRILDIFTTSNCNIRPHFMLTGESGSGKSLIIQSICKQNKLNFIEVNAAQLTKEGTSGNSLSKALSPLVNTGNRPTVVFVDEFDKLFISGNSNSELAHETTNGVQNEFLKVLESDTVSVFGDYGKYINVPSTNILFIFGGAFNGESDISIDRLRELGIKTEFLGRVGIVFNTKKLSLNDLFLILEHSPLLENYLHIFEDVDREKTILELKAHIQTNYESNSLGARMINTLINQYFIGGGKIETTVVKQSTFQNKLKL